MSEISVESEQDAIAAPKQRGIGAIGRNGVERVNVVSLGNTVVTDTDLMPKTSMP